MNHYETVFILNPVLSEQQVKETVSKFEEFLTSRGAEMVSKEDWGLKKLAYEIQNKKSGFYHLFEFKVSRRSIIAFETEFRRDERVMRFLTVSLRQTRNSWAERRRTKLKAAKAKLIMATLQQSASGKKDGDIRYLTPLNIETNKTKKYCRFKKSGIKYIDYKDADFLLKFVNEQGKILPRRLTGTSLKYQRKVSVAVKRARHLALMPYVADLLK
jgi:ribosomal protein S18/ribosomal protein S6